MARERKSAEQDEENRLSLEERQKAILLDDLNFGRGASSYADLENAAHERRRLQEAYRETVLLEMLDFGRTNPVYADLRAPERAKLSWFEQSEQEEAKNNLEAEILAVRKLFQARALSAMCFDSPHMIPLFLEVFNSITDADMALMNANAKGAVFRMGLLDVTLHTITLEKEQKSAKPAVEVSAAAASQERRIDSSASVAAVSQEPERQLTRKQRAAAKAAEEKRIADKLAAKVAAQRNKAKEQQAEQSRAEKEKEAEEARVKKDKAQKAKAKKEAEEAAALAAAEKIANAAIRDKAKKEREALQVKEPEARAKLIDDEEIWRSEIANDREWGFVIINGNKFLQAASDNDIETVRAILTQDPLIINYQDKRSGETALIRACMYGNNDVVRFLLHMEASCNMRDCNGINAFNHYVVAYEVDPGIIELTSQGATYKEINDGYNYLLVRQIHKVSSHEAANMNYSPEKMQEIDRNLDACCDLLKLLVGRGKESPPMPAGSAPQTFAQRYIAENGGLHGTESDVYERYSYTSGAGAARVIVNGELVNVPSDVTGALERLQRGKPNEGGARR